MQLQRAQAEIDELRGRLAELEVAARRYRALIDSSAVSVQVYRADGTSDAVNGAYEKLWRVSAAEVATYNVLADPQVRAHGMMPLVERVFHEGHSAQMPSIRYDPQKNEKWLRARRRGWPRRCRRWSAPTGRSRRWCISTCTSASSSRPKRSCASTTAGSRRRCRPAPPSWRASCG
ncbi:hypothetical protein [Nannocystis pusilla]|uniref:hypothetical protein n=1 Tax=Nannocystis pusilla TaxID=889268 RepID=UPI003B7BFE59